MRLRALVWYLVLLVSLVLLAISWRTFVDVSSIRGAILPWLPRIAFALMVLFTVNLFLEATRPLVKNALGRYFSPWDRRIFFSVYTYTVWALAIMIIVMGIFGSLSSLGISFGLIGAGLAFALQQVILSFAGWFLIVIKKPYRIGDRIRIKRTDLLGDVENVTLFFTVLKEVDERESVTGRNIIIPNSTVFQEPIVNYNYDVPYIWQSVPFSITYESDLMLAQQIILDVAKSVAGEDMRKAAFLIRKTTPLSVQIDMAREEPIIRVEFADSSITVNARIMCLPKKLREFKSDIYQRVFEAFNRPENKGKVEIAYPHMELVLHDEVMSQRIKRFLDKG